MQLTLIWGSCLLWIEPFGSLNLPRIHRRFIVLGYADRVVQDREAALRAYSEDKVGEEDGDIDLDSGRPFIKVNHPAPTDIVSIVLKRC
jgi:hypothetical protein